MEAEKETVPLLERFTFLSIYSSNLDEFYRVRIPALMAVHKLYQKKNVDSKISGKYADVLGKAQEIISLQLEKFGNILRALIPELLSHRIALIYDTSIPEVISTKISDYFFSEVLAFIQPIVLREGTKFFPENNQLYLAVLVENSMTEDIVIVNIPANQLQRFYSVSVDEHSYISFLDDIIKAHLPIILPGRSIKGSYSFKVTRDAELNLEEDYEGDTADKIEKQIAKRDYGFATRFLYDSRFPAESLRRFADLLELQNAMHMEGGSYHNLRDLSKLPVNAPSLKNVPWPAIKFNVNPSSSLFDTIAQRDLLVHTPYQSYDIVLRFFNEASIDPAVTEIYTTMYRVASESKIVNALISAARNGKKVVALVELKARFDEANNVKWSKRLKAAGVKVLYTEDSLKVHAKIALVKKKKEEETIYHGLLATGNMHEVTARLYTDHILMTSNKAMLKEVEIVFSAFDRKAKPVNPVLHHLLVAQFNLQERFLALIDREIDRAKIGRPAYITIKLNNLEEKVLIKKLYEASNAGVKINLIVRSICCLIPGVDGMSENITVRRIVDRYLEHGRVFVFCNGGDELVFLGSADWMNRNIYKRIEVCFPIYNKVLKQEILNILDLQWKDNAQAVELDYLLQNVPVVSPGNSLRSQRAIYEYLLSQSPVD